MKTLSNFETPNQLFEPIPWHPHKFARLLNCLILAMGLILGLLWLIGDNPQSASAASFTVTTLIDENDGSCSDGDCSLRDAIILANANGQPDTITLGDDTYILSIPGSGENAAATGDLDITESLTITGQGPSQTTIDANDLDRVFAIQSSALRVVINNLTIKNGNSPFSSGGGIHSSNSDLELNNVVIDSNQAENGAGGIYASGKATLNSVIIQDNRVKSLYDHVKGGGMVADECDLTLSNVQFVDNKIVDDHLGGGGLAISDCEAKLNKVTLSGNQALYGGGLYITSGSNVVMTDTQISQNTARYEEVADSVLPLSPNSFVGPSRGGGLYVVESSTVLMVAGEVSENTADGTESSGGGLYQIGNCTTTFQSVAIFGNTSGKYGGGINVGSSSATFSLSADNGSLRFENVTISQNSSDDGGGVFNDHAIAVFENTTIADNTGGGISMSGDGISQFHNTIVDHNLPINCDGDSTNLLSNGFNLDSGHTCRFLETTDQVDTDPQLGALQNNGGRTHTHALLPGSPAIDAGQCVAGILVDQRGWPRPNPKSIFCDIGAYEARAGGSTDLSISKTVIPAEVAPGDPITFTLTYSHTGPSGAVGVVISDSLPSEIIGSGNYTSSGADVTLVPGSHFIWLVDDLLPGQGGMITFTGRLRVPAAAGIFTNTVSINSTAVDPKPGNNHSQATVNVLNLAPLTVDNHYTTAEDTPLSPASPGVLGNDGDPNGDPLSALIVSATAHGTLLLRTDGSFDYEPDADYVGEDSFTYFASDGLLASNTATVTINVGAINDAPVAVDDAYDTDEDTLLIIIAPGLVLDNDSDPDGDSLMAILESDPENGTLTFRSDGSFDYLPNDDYSGQDSFTYHASDGSLASDTVTVTIDVTPVNDTPQATDNSYNTAMDTSLNVAAPGLLANDSDPDGDLLTAVLDTGPSDGTLTLNEDGSFSYTPNTGYVGEVYFTYKASDGELESLPAVVTINVKVNEAPLAVSDSYTTSQDTLLEVYLPGVLDNDSDPNDDSLIAVLDTDVEHGTLTLNANGSFNYLPDAEYTGQDNFSYHASDGDLDSTIVTVTITVEAVVTEYNIYLPMLLR